jgi:hypothetical protein
MERRGAAPLRPYVIPTIGIGIHDPNNPMHVIGHHHKFIGIQHHTRAHNGGMEPFVTHNLPVFIQPHFALHDFAEQTGAVMGANGDEIRAGLGVIIFLQADGSTMVAVGDRMT